MNRRQQQKKPYLIMIPKMYVEILEMMSRNAMPTIKVKFISFEKNK